MMDTILPCPSCAGTDIDPEGWSGGQGEYGPECFTCGMAAPSVAIWNRRPQPSAPVQPVAWVKHGGIPATTTDPLIKMAWEADGFSVSPLVSPAPREPTEAEREALWAAMHASSEIVHPGRIVPSAQPQPDEPEVVKMLSKVIEGWKECAAQWDDEGDSPRASDYIDCADELEEFLKWYRKPDGHFPRVAAQTQPEEAANKQEKCL